MISCTSYKNNAREASTSSCWSDLTYLVDTTPPRPIKTWTRILQDICQTLTKQISEIIMSATNVDKVLYTLSATTLAYSFGLSAMGQQRQQADKKQAQPISPTRLSQWSLASSPCPCFGTGTSMNCPRRSRGTCISIMWRLKTFAHIIGC